MYTTKAKAIKNIGRLIGIHEYIENFKGAKWKVPKEPVGTSDAPITDEQLNEFIKSHNVFELCLKIKDKRGEMRHIDFSLSDLE